MEAIPYFLCFAAGIIVDAVYHRCSKVAEQKAYDRGYNKGRKQALKETEAKNKIEESYSVATEPETKDMNIAVIPESFMNDLHTYGKAVWRRRK